MFGMMSLVSRMLRRGRAETVCDSRVAWYTPLCKSVLRPPIDLFRSPQSTCNDRDAPEGRGIACRLGPGHHSATGAAFKRNTA
jgi:hypothetical protein